MQELFGQIGGDQVSTREEGQEKLCSKIAETHSEQAARYRNEGSLDHDNPKDSLSCPAQRSQRAKLPRSLRHAHHHGVEHAKDADNPRDNRKQEYKFIDIGKLLVESISEFTGAPGDKPRNLTFNLGANPGRVLWGRVYKDQGEVGPVFC